jgi:hypothetical protein
MKRFVINSLGEPFIQGDDYGTSVGSGSINVVETAEQVLSPKDFKMWQELDDDDPKYQILDAYVSRCVQHQFYVDAYDEMGLTHFGLYVQTLELQQLNDSRFRFWSEQVNKSKPKIWFVTEFQWWVDDESFWKQLHALAAENKYKINVMSEDDHVDKHWDDSDPATAYNPPEGREERAIIGENHGRIERQVEFRVNVYGKSMDEIKEILERHADLTQHVWEQAGVGVI